MSLVEWRPSLPGDLAIVSPDPLPFRLRSITMLRDGEVIGVGGLVFRLDGTVWLGAFLTPPAREAKFALHRTCLKFLREARERGVGLIFALPDPAQPRSEAWLTHLGFTATELFEHGRRVWQWTADRGGGAQ